MSATVIRPLLVKFWGDTACFARPEFPTERVSYMAPTPSAIRGMLEAIYWKPEFHWRVREIRILNPIKHFSETRNEVSVRAGRNSLTRGIDPAACRIQRHTTGLKDVAYVIVAEAIPNEDGAEYWDKHAQIFTRRVDVGQCFSTPYFGSREHTAKFGPATGGEDTINLTLDLGRMVFDNTYAWPTFGADRNRCVADRVMFDAKIVNGVLAVPDQPYARAGGCRGSDRRQPRELAIA